MAHYSIYYLRDDKKTRVISTKDMRTYVASSDGRESLVKQKNYLHSFCKYKIKSENKGKNRIVGYRLFKFNRGVILSSMDVILRVFT